MKFDWKSVNVILLFVLRFMWANGITHRIDYTLCINGPWRTLVNNRKRPYRIKRHQQHHNSGMLWNLIEVEMWNMHRKETQNKKQPQNGRRHHPEHYLDCPSLWITWWWSSSSFCSNFFFFFNYVIQKKKLKLCLPIKEPQRCEWQKGMKWLTITSGNWPRHHNFRLDFFLPTIFAIFAKDRKKLEHNYRLN